MGNELVSDSLLDKDKRGEGLALTPFNYTYTEKFYEVFPFYLSIGMTADEFWNQDCNLTKYYRKAHELKKDRKNEELWLQGLYIYEAILDVSPILHAFAEKGTKPLPYPKEPYPRSEQEQKEREKRNNILRFNQMKADLLARVNKNKNEEV